MKRRIYFTAVLTGVLAIGVQVVIAAFSPAYGPYYRWDKPWNYTYTIYGYTEIAFQLDYVKARTRVLAQHEVSTPAFDKVVLVTRVWGMSSGTCPYRMVRETIASRTNASETNETVTWLGGSGYLYETSKHKLIDDQTSKSQPPSGLVPPGSFYTSRSIGQDTKNRFRGLGQPCNTLPPPPPGDDDGSETG